MENPATSWFSTFDSITSVRGRVQVLVCGLILFNFAGCQPTRESKTKKGPANQVVVTTYPYQFFAQQLLGPEIEVHYPAAIAENPRIWQPTPTDIETMQDADLIITGGPALPYAEWISKVSLPESRILKCSNALKLSEYVHIEDYRVVHQHGPTGEHSHPLLIPYSWLDPAMAIKQADYIAQQLKKTYPDRVTTIDVNLDRLNESLSELIQQARQIDAGSTKVICTSPNLSFITAALGIENEYLLWIEPATDEAEKNERQNEIRDRFNDDPTIVILAASPFAEETIRQAIPENGPKIVTINLLDHAPKNGNYLDTLKKMISNLNQGLASPPAAQ